MNAILQLLVQENTHPDCLPSMKFRIGLPKLDNYYFASRVEAERELRRALQAFEVQNPAAETAFRESDRLTAPTLGSGSPMSQTEREKCVTRAIDVIEEASEVLNQL